jgi:hypothetical protein
LLEAETTVVLMKGRVQGTTGKYTKMIYKKEHSRFYPLAQSNNASAPDGALPSGDPDNPF